MAFKLGNERRGIKNSKTTPIFRKKLDKGIVAEANLDGSIFINKNVKPGSALEKRAIRHEKQHLKDMSDPKIGLSYGDDYVRYKGKTYLRKNGKIKYNGKFHEEGSMVFPWEQRAKKAE